MTSSRKIPITRFGLFEHCKRRTKCEYFDKTGKTCKRPDNQEMYLEDKVEKRRQTSINRKEAEDYLATFKRIRRDQISLTCRFAVNFSMKPKHERSKLSHAWDIRKDEQNDAWTKWCENCGAEFSTQNETRRLCDGCWDEICNKLGVNYAWATANRSARS